MRLRSFAMAGVLSFNTWLVCPTSAIAQNEPEYYAKPTNTGEFWRALQFEVSVGKFELAAEHLKELLAKNPTEEELLAIEAKEGMVPFLKLRNITEWFRTESKDERVLLRTKTANDEAKKNVEILTEKMTAALQKKLGDETRIVRFSKNLLSVPEEAAFARKELIRSGSLAIPTLLQLMINDPGLRTPIRETLSGMDLAAVPAMVAALELPNAPVQLELLEAIRNRADYSSLSAQVETDVRPILHYLADERSGTTGELRSQAVSMLNGLITRDPKDGFFGDLATNEGQLWKSANRLYDHQARFREQVQVPLWQLTGTKLQAANGTVSDAEEFYGLKYLRWALKLKPDYARAQQLFLMLALEKHYKRTGLDKKIEETSPELQDALVGAPYDLLTEILRQAVQEQKSGAPLAVISAVATRADGRSIAGGMASDGSQKPSLLEKALDHPDFRVQIAAADAILRIVGNGKVVASEKVVKILGQALKSGVVNNASKPTALIGDSDNLRAEHLAKLVRNAGYQVEIFKTGRDLLQRVYGASTVDLVIVDTKLPYPMLPDLLAQLRADPRFGGLPVIVSQGFEKAKEANLTSLQRVVAPYRNVSFVKEMLTDSAVQDEIVRVSVNGQIPALSAAEKQAQAALAMDWIRRIALGERKGYSVTSIAGSVRDAFSDPALVTMAVEAAANIPNREVQQDLANIFLNNTQSLELRLKASESLIRQLQQFGNGLASNQVQAFQSMGLSEENPRLKGRVATLLGIVKSDAKFTGELLQKYIPKAVDSPATPKTDAKPNNGM